MEKQTVSIVLGGGCFWCLDAGFRLIRGVLNVCSGFAGGHTVNPTYYDVVNGSTGHAEVVKVYFDANVISLNDILDIFWTMHNPTTLNRQGHDVGSQYRSIILFNNQNQEKIINESIESISKYWSDPITTEVSKLKDFYKAEEEHQNFFQKHPELAYCQAIINPKLNKLRLKFENKLDLKTMSSFD